MTAFQSCTFQRSNLRLTARHKFIVAYLFGLLYFSGLPRPTEIALARKHTRNCTAAKFFQILVRTYRKGASEPSVPCEGWKTVLPFHINNILMVREFTIVRREEDSFIGHIVFQCGFQSLTNAHTGILTFLQALLN